MMLLLRASARRHLSVALAGFIAAGGSLSLAAREPSANSGGEYVIGVEDRLQVSVWREGDLSLSVVVRPDGKITFPLVGDLQAAGRTPRELREAITEAISAFVKGPLVSVIVQEINSFKVYVLGEVNSQGMLQLRQPTRLLQAIAMAGGLTSYADKGKVVLVRDTKGRETRILIDYRKIVSGERPDLNLYLSPGDTIIVN